MTTEGDKLIVNANLPRTRDLSFVGRFHHNFGFEEGLFEYLLAQKELWGDKLFYLNELPFQQAVSFGQHQIRQIPEVAYNELQFPKNEASEILKGAFEAQFGTLNGIDLNFVSSKGESKQTLNHGDSLALQEMFNRNARILNVGGIITAMKWLPYGSLLAVAVTYHKEGLSKAITSPSLLIFNNPINVEDVKSCIQFYKYDPETTLLSLRKVLITSSFGATSNLNWLPFKVKEETSGVLSGLFSDGKVHFFRVDIPALGTQYLDVSGASWTISMSDEAGSAQLPITAYDIFDETKIIVGTLDGAIAEFVLPGIDEHPEEPSFVEYVTDSAISTVTVAPVLNGHVLLVNTTTTRSFAILYENLRQSRLETAYTILFLPPRYHRGYRIFVYPDSAESIGYTFVRHPHQKHSLLLRTELISSFHISEYLNHPFALVGNAAGDFYVINIGRKIFGVPKAHNKLVVPLKIWSLFLEDDRKTLRLVGDYEPSSADKAEVAYSFTPHEVGVSACAWNEGFDGSSTYAMGTYSGLLVLERLDPLLN